MDPSSEENKSKQQGKIYFQGKKHFLLAMTICIYDVVIKCEIQIKHGSTMQI